MLGAMSSWLLVLLLGCDPTTEPASADTAGGGSPGVTDTGGGETTGMDSDSAAPGDSGSETGATTDTSTETDTDPVTDRDTDPPGDADGDGHLSDEDCDDDDASVYPGASELCDGVDRDCDGVVTDGGVVTFTTVAGVTTELTGDFAAGTEWSAAAVVLSEAGTLELCPGTFYVGLTLSADVTVRGLDGAETTTLSAAGSGAVITVETDGVGVSIIGVSLTGGAGGACGSTEDATHGGGVCCNAAATVSLSQAAVHDNQATYGAGLSLEGCDLVLEDTELNDNQGSYGGGLYVTDATVTITDTSFSGNTAGGEGGGALFEDMAAVALTRTVFTGGVANKGGGLHDRSGASVSLIDCELSDNLVTREGGGARFEDTVSVLVEGGSFTGNSAVDGAGLYSDGPDFLLQDTLFQANVATGYGGGVNLTGVTTASLDGFTALDNDGGYGGGLYADTVGTLTLSACAFDANAVNNEGGAVYLISETATIDTCDFSANQARFGAGVYDHYGSTLIVADSSFTDNEASYDGGGLYFGGTETAEVSGGTFSGNIADSGAGVVFYIDQTATLTDSTFDTNVGSAFGGALSIYQVDDASISRVSFDGNSAAYGGALSSYDASALTLSETTLSANSASNQGGGAWVYGCEALRIEDSTASGNSSGEGGGLYLTTSDGTCVGSSGAAAGLTANTASSSGGAVFIGDPSTTFSSETCDFGTAAGADDNGPDDIASSKFQTSYGDDATFTCDRDGCVD